MNYEQRRTDSLGINSDPKPVEIGKEYEVQITEISRKGDGIARIQGFVIFVKNGQVGQNVKVKVTQIGSTFATAEIV
ncbi:MAG TPA: TRAM domain-containing protein [Nitrososphaeraceae archaeon]|jgi:predicted RNA-binding protein with TRAM domain|nr:TRAM domain-containing protein [Nitrososphaeraceae archaeon]